MEPTMFTKRSMSISLLLRLVAIPTTAEAGSTITDKSYWPNEAKQGVQNLSDDSQSGVNSAFA
jgi:alcohol dehydrogenase class IV